MKITLANGAELNPIIVTGSNRRVYGVGRDALTFVFPADAGMENIDAMFSVENCERITIVEDGGASYIHNAYTIRAALSKEAVEVAPATEESEAVYEDRIMVTMAQRTYSESQLASLTETVDVLVMESLMS